MPDHSGNAAASACVCPVRANPEREHGRIRDPGSGICGGEKFFLKCVKVVAVLFKLIETVGAAGGLSAFS